MKSKVHVKAVFKLSLKNKRKESRRNSFIGYSFGETLGGWKIKEDLLKNACKISKICLKCFS